MAKKPHLIPGQGDLLAMLAVLENRDQETGHDHTPTVTIPGPGAPLPAHNAELHGEALDTIPGIESPADNQMGSAPGGSSAPGHPTTDEPRGVEGRSPELPGSDGSVLRKPELMDHPNDSGRVLSADRNSRSGPGEGRSVPQASERPGVVEGDAPTQQPVPGIRGRGVSADESEPVLLDVDHVGAEWDRLDSAEGQGSSVPQQQAGLDSDLSGLSGFAGPSALDLPGDTSNHLAAPDFDRPQTVRSPISDMVPGRTDMGQGVLGLDDQTPPSGRLLDLGGTDKPTQVLENDDRSGSVHENLPDASAITPAGSGAVAQQLVDAHPTGPDGEFQDPTNHRPGLNLAGGEASDFTPGTHIHPPSGKVARFEANIAALQVLADLDISGQWATKEQQQVLARWSGWGHLPEVFELHREDWVPRHQQLASLLTQEQLDQASRTTLNAHYTDPEVVAQIWQAVRDLGFTEDGLVLEPGSGSGNFIGAAPANAKMVGVELDEISAKISSYLYPSAHIAAQGLERLRFGGAAARPFDVVVGNVPFGSYRIFDPIDNPARASVHNYFINKSINRTRPGGLVAVITSRYTMDAQNATSRTLYADKADLLGAVRLPSGAFKEVAGTDVVTDILIFRRRLDNQTRDKGLPAWLQVSPIEVPGAGDETVSLNINNYFHQNPQNVLGELTSRNGLHGSELTVEGPSGDQMISALSDRLRTIVAGAYATGLAYVPRGAIFTPPQWYSQGLHLPKPVAEQYQDGHIRVNGNGFERWVADSETFEPITKIRPADRQKVSALLGLRDQAVKVVETQTAGESQQQRDAARLELARRYDQYVQKFGPIHAAPPIPGREARAAKAKGLGAWLAKEEAAWRASYKKQFPEALEDEIVATPDLKAGWEADYHNLLKTDVVYKQPHLDHLRSDPNFALVLALESYDRETGTATKTQIFETDIAAPSAQHRTASTPGEALTISLDETGQVDLGRIGELLGLEQDNQVIEQLGDLVYLDPQTEQWQPAVLYLSGQVRTKLTLAREAAQTDSRYLRNVEALQQVVPDQLLIEDITLRPGTPYLTTDLHQQFISEVLKARTKVLRHPATERWEIDAPPSAKINPAVYLEYGTTERTPFDLLKSVMNNTPITVYDTIPLDGKRTKRVQNPLATTAARAKAKALTDRFATWIKEDPHRAAQVAATYNQMFNGYRPADYGQLGKNLALPGLSPKFKPHPYQRAAVAQIINSPATLLDHVVGAGKTGSYTMGVMELRRLGLARKPWAVVPNHLVDQIASEWKTWYPTAKVLAIPTGIDQATRNQYVARAATGDWDVVICPNSTFKSIPLNPGRVAAWEAEEIAKLRATLSDLPKSGSTKDVARTKAVEKKIASLESRYDQYLSKKDPGLTFEQTGCDFLLVDEADMFKNLSRESGNPELAHAGSQQARDLDFKLRAMREAKAEAGISPTSPTVAFATGTPIANSLAEMWVMTHYLRPDLFEQMGINSIDDWAGAFVRLETKMELGPDGVTWKARERIVGFTNAPEMLGIYNQFTSVVTREQVPAKLPSLATGKRITVERQRSEAVAEYVNDLAQRANNLDGVDPTEDNLLKITSDGKKVALDPRLVGLAPDPDGGRVASVADQIMQIHNTTKDTVYNDPVTSTPHPTTGGLQLVFCDQSVPRDDGRFSFYTALKDELVSRGMDPSQVAFMQDATDDAAKAAMFKEARAGNISVLIGSTERMGAGTNVQDRMTAIHHVDCPWRPRDLEQREGRGIRQGNQNSEISIFNYVTAKTYDAVVWQHIVRKANFIQAVKTGQFVGREIEDIGDDIVMSAAEVQAIATGDPRVMRRAELLEDVTRLEQLEQGWRSDVAGARQTIKNLQIRIATSQERNRELAKLIQTHTGGPFNFTTSDGTVLTAPGDTGQWLKNAISRVRGVGVEHETHLGTLNGIDVVLQPGPDLTLSTPGRIRTLTHIPAPILNGMKGVVDVASLSDVGLAQRLTNSLTSMGADLTANEQQLATWGEELVEVTARANQLSEGFTKAGELEALRTELAEIEQDLSKSDSDVQDQGPEYVSGELLEEKEVCSTTGLGSSDLRAGDIVYEKSKPTRFYTIAPADETTRRDWELFELDSGQSVGHVTYARDYHLVKRDLAQLTEFEVATLSRAEDTAYVGTRTVPPIGATITVQGMRATIQNGRLSYGSRRDMATWQATFLKEEQVGTNRWSSETAWQIQDEAGETHLIRPLGKYLHIGGRNPHQPKPERYLPRVGDVVDVTDTDANTCRQMYRTYGWVSLTPGVDPIGLWDTNNTVSLVAEGRNLSAEEISVLYGQETLQMPISQLVAGDVLGAQELDRNAATNDLIQITDASGNDYTYHYLDEPDTNHNVRRVTSTADPIVPLHSRKWAAVPEAELRVAFDPGAISADRLGDLEGAEGQLLYFPGSRMAPAILESLSTDFRGYLSGVKFIDPTTQETFTQHDIGHWTSVVVYEPDSDPDSFDITGMGLAGHSPDQPTIHQPDTALHTAITNALSL